jgi:hypothetical protein
MRRRENKRREVPSARTRRRFLAVLVAACLFVAIAAAAQQPPCTQRTIPVSVVTQAGQPVTGLTAANFTAKFDGRPLLISSVTAPKSPPTVLILLDVSNSMRYFPGGLEGELRLAELLVLRLPSDIPAGLALLRERVVLAAAPKTDRNSFNQAIERIRADSKVTKARGATALWDALLAALNLSGQLGAGDVIYVVTDGVDNSSHATMVQAQQAALGAGVRIFAALLGQRGFERKYASPFERDMSDTSGGDVLDIPDSQKEWPDAVGLQSVEIANPYDLTLELSASPQKARDLHLNLTDLDKSAAKHPILRYPQQLVPCPSPRS